MYIHVNYHCYISVIQPSHTQPTSLQIAMLAGPSKGPRWAGQVKVFPYASGVPDPSGAQCPSADKLWLLKTCWLMINEDDLTQEIGDHHHLIGECLVASQPVGKILCFEHCSNDDA